MTRSKVHRRSPQNRVSLTGAPVFRQSLGFVFCSLITLTNVALAQCHFSSKSNQDTVTYRFRPEVTPAGLVMHVMFSFRVGSSGMATLVVPTRWAGETLRAVTNLHIDSRGASLEGGVDEASRTVHSKPHRFVTVSYDLRKDWIGPLVNPLQFHPVLTPDYFEFTGSNALVRLRLDDGALETANFDWRELPAAWSLATSFGATTSATERCQTYSGPWRKVNEGLYAGGDYRIHPFQITGRPAFLAVRGTWTFSDEEAVADIQKVVGMVRDFWHDDNFPYFLVTLKPFDRDHGSSDGSAFTNAFWMYVSRLDSLTPLLPQLAHEAFHAWDSARMGMEPAGYDEASIKWFREGPTEYYAQLLTYKAGELPASQYVNSLNIALRKFSASDDEYVRGRVISLWLDGTIRSESVGRQSLDNVMFEMVRTGDQPFTLARILATADRYLPPSARDELQRAVVDHGDLPMPEHLPGLGACTHASLENVSTFDPGLDLDRTTATKIVTGVVENGPGFAAGLRNGQTLLTTSVYKGDPEHLAKFKVHTDAGDQQINFYPRGKTIRAWQYHLDASTPCQSD